MSCISSLELYDIYISYHFKNHFEANRLYQTLSFFGNCKFKCWIDFKQIKVGVNNDGTLLSIKNGLKQSRLVIGLIDFEYNNTPQCRRELKWAIELNKPIIFMFLNGCNESYLKDLLPKLNSTKQDYYFIKETIYSSVFKLNDKFIDLLVNLLRKSTAQANLINENEQFSSASLESFSKPTSLPEIQMKNCLHSILNNNKSNKIYKVRYGPHAFGIRNLKEPSFITNLKQKRLINQSLESISRKYLN
jgi:hypothetical protein